MTKLLDEKLYCYKSLCKIFNEASDEILSHTLDYDDLTCYLKQSISECPRIISIFENAATSCPNLVTKTNGVYRIRMISSDTENEKDPIHDTFSIFQIKDMFWIKHILDNAIYYSVLADENYK